MRLPAAAGAEAQGAGPERQAKEQAALAVRQRGTFRQDARGAGQARGEAVELDAAGRGLDRVDHLVTLSAPHNGTIMAHLVPNRGCREMRPNSPFLRDLAQDADRLEQVKFTSLYTLMDLVIIPQRSSEMPQATNIRMPVLAHPFMVIDKRCLRTVAEALRG